MTDFKHKFCAGCEEWYANQTARKVHEFDEYDHHICRVIMKWSEHHEQR